VNELAQGPFFFLFASVPFISMLMFLFVARDWASLNERFHLLGPLSFLIADSVTKSPVDRSAMLRLDRGFRTSGRRLRSLVEILLVGAWFFIVVAISVQILRWLESFASTPKQDAWLTAGWIGLAVALLSVLVVLVTFLTRSYKDPDVKPKTGPKVAPPSADPPAPSTSGGRSLEARS
jgi:hypothetical protein